jgi:hypothetical protein
MRTAILLAVALATEKHSAVAYDSPENIVLLDAVGEEIALVDAAAEELVGPLTSGKAGKSSISKAEKEEYTSDSAEPDEVEAKAFKGTKSSKGGDSSMSMAKAFKDGKSAKAGYGRYFYKLLFCCEHICSLHSLNSKCFLLLLLFRIIWSFQQGIKANKWHVDGRCGGFDWYDYHLFCHPLSA